MNKDEYVIGMFKVNFMVNVKNSVKKVIVLVKVDVKGVFKVKILK